MFNDPYLDEEIAQVKTIALWCEGRLDDLLREELIEGGACKLTPSGLQAYRNLLATGYKPDPKRLRIYLEHRGDINPSSLDHMCKIMLHFDDYLAKHRNQESTDDK